MSDPTPLHAAMYRAIGSRLTDARVAELMKHGSIPLHGRPISNAAGYVAALLRADIKDEIDKALAALSTTPAPLRQSCASCGHDDVDHAASGDGSCVAPDCWCAALSTTPAPLDVEPARHPIWEEVADELHRAQSQHGPMASGHEAQSVIGEEFHEFTLAVWFGVDQKGRPADPRAEAVQIAAMAVRYILDVADRSTP